MTDHVNYAEVRLIALNFRNRVRDDNRVINAPIIRQIYADLSQTLEQSPMGRHALDCAIRAMLTDNAEQREYNCDLLLRDIDSLFRAEEKYYKGGD